MESIKARQRVEQDGIIHLDIPVGLANRDVEVVVIYQSVQSLTTIEPSLESLYDICADDPIILDNWGILKALDDKLAEAFD